MRKILFFIFLLLPTSPLAVAPCGQQDYIPIEQRYERGLLFKISKCGVQDSYILGTMHSDIPQVGQAIPSKTYEILGAANSANFELKKDAEMKAQLIVAMFYPRDERKNLRMAIGEQRYAELQAALHKHRKDLTENIYAKMRPWAVGLLNQVPADENDGVHLDARLENIAEEKLVPVYGLETVEEQLSVFTSLPEEDQIEFLQEGIDNLAVIKEMNHKLLSRYLQQDLVALQSLADESFAMMKNADLKHRLEERLITQRNLVMLERMQPRLTEGNAFIAVGALHLPTEKGLLYLLEQQGFHIQVVND